MDYGPEICAKRKRGRPEKVYFLDKEPLDILILALKLKPTGDKLLRMLKQKELNLLQLIYSIEGPFSNRHMEDQYIDEITMLKKQLGEC